jgi:alpha-N-acetylglucosaminidase
MVAASEKFLGMCDQLVEVLKTCPEFSLNDWIRDARAWGKNKAEKDYYEMNARTIITVWGDTYHLSDYANRDWDGLVETFYKVRWKMFFDAVLAAYDAGEPFVNLRGPRVPNGKTKEESKRALDLDAKIWEFETKWARWK